MERYRDRRSPDRGRYSRDAPPIDSYIPSGSRSARPRSRSPDNRFHNAREPPRADTWRGRARSPLPPRRHDSRDAYYVNSRDARPRSPRRDYGPPDPRYDGASRAGRARSPTPLKRGREFSPNGRAARSPPPAKRERLASPPREYTRVRSPPRRGYSPPRDRGYRPRSRSPPRREERADPYAVKSWRRRSPSPRVIREGSGRESGNTSRRSSPKPPRIRGEQFDLEKSRPPPADTYRRSPPRARSPPRGSYEYGPSRPEYPPNGDSFSHREVPQHAVDYRDRPPPTGPANSRGPPPSGPHPPVGPSSATSMSMSAHNRPSSSSVPPPPSYPRGGYGSFRGRGGPPPPRDYPQPHRDFGPPPRREPAAFGGHPGFGRGPPPPREPYPPRDPRPPRDPYAYEGRGPPPRRGGDPYGPPPPLFRGSSNSTATTYPRTQRFSNALSDLPKIKEGGEKLPPLHETGKADKLEEEAARLRKAIDDREIKKRSGLREWNKLERGSGTASLKSDLAEEHLRSLNGEADGMGAAF